MLPPLFFLFLADSKLALSIMVFNPTISGFGIFMLVSCQINFSIRALFLFQWKMKLLFCPTDAFKCHLVRMRTIFVPVSPPSRLQVLRIHFVCIQSLKDLIAQIRRRTSYSWAILRHSSPSRVIPLEATSIPSSTINRGHGLNHSVILLHCIGSCRVKATSMRNARPWCFRSSWSDSSTSSSLIVTCSDPINVTWHYDWCSCKRTFSDTVWKKKYTWQCRLVAISRLKLVEHTLSKYQVKYVYQRPNLDVSMRFFRLTVTAVVTI